MPLHSTDSLYTQHFHLTEDFVAVEERIDGLSQAAFKYIHFYLPYDQLTPGEYPPIMATAGLNDPRETYWEPAKYVAKLRAVKTDDNLALLKTGMGSGHGGRSGRTARWYEIAEEYAFMLASLGLAE